MYKGKVHHRGRYTQLFCFNMEYKSNTFNKA